MQSIRYRVLDHDEWAAIHPGKCFFAEPVPKIHNSKPVPESGTGPVPKCGTGEKNHQSQFSTSTSPSFHTSPVPNFDFSPVPKTGTKTVKEKREPKTVKKDGVNQTELLIANSQPNRLRVSQTILATLTTAGERGLSSVELAGRVYGNKDNRARDLIVQVVARLRRQGFSIVLVGHDPYSRRYVLQEN
jgi:hypothetical protein